ncbi:MAG: rod shape-determining protein MreD [Desulfobulbus propionicus]|nr:MAG: rod shape-determining protein MreD [Desulfobulbus propionicus]
MLILFFTLTGLLLVVLQTTVFMLNPVWVAAPDLYYILVAYLAYRVDILRSLIVIFFLGCILDVFSGTILGMYSVFCLAAFFILRLIARKMPVSDSLYQVPLVGVSYLFVSWIMYMLITAFHSDLLFSWVWWEMMVRSLLIVVFSYWLFHFFDFAHRRISKGVFSWKKLRVHSDNRYRSR